MPTITKHAMIQRIRRALRKHDERLRYNRRDDTYMVIDLYGNYVMELDVDLDATAKELGVLHPLEVVAA